MDHDDIRVFLVDAAGTDLGRFEVTFSRPLEVGTHTLFQLHADRAPELYHVLGVRPGEGGRPFVQVIAAGEVEQDAAGLYVTCRQCQRRVNFEQVPTPPGSPLRFRLAPEQAWGEDLPIG